jgi:hypothetical protein
MPARRLQPLGVLVEHRVDDVDERLVAVEEPVAAGQEVALEPALAQVLGQDLHHPAVRGEVVVAGPLLLEPRAIGDLEQGRQPVGRGLVRSHDPEPVRVRAMTSRRNSPITLVASEEVVPGRATSTA